MRMRSVHDKPDERAPLFLWTKDASARQLADALGCIMRKLRVVLENHRPPDLLDVINRGCKPNSACDVWRSCFEAVRRFLERALFQSDAHDHFTATVPRWHRIENRRAPVKRADPSRSTHLVSGERKEIAAQFAHIDRHVSRALRGVHERERAHRMRLLAKFRDGI